jgi:hypothetical protein
MLGAVQCAAQTPAIRIIQPTNGSVLFSQQGADIIAELAPVFQDPANLNHIEFSATKTDGSSVFPLGRGDLRWSSSFELAHVLWQTSTAPSGEYTIQAVLQDAGGTLFSDRVVVTVNQAPVIRVDVVQQQSLAGGVQISFRSVVRDTENDPITRVIWNAGDGAPDAELPVTSIFTHFYAGMPGQDVDYILTAQADDARGGRGIVQRDVTVSTQSAVVRQTDDCGCNNMQVLSSSGVDSFLYCNPGPNIPTDPGLVGCMAASPAFSILCPNQHTAYLCPLGPFAPGDRNTQTLGWAFEVKPSLIAEQTIRGGVWRDRLQN